MYDGVEAILKAKGAPIEVPTLASLTYQGKGKGIPLYYTFYKPPSVAVSTKEIKFIPPIEERSVKGQFWSRKDGILVKDDKILEGRNVPYESIP